MNCTDIGERILKHGRRVAWSASLERPSFVWVSPKGGPDNVPETDCPFNTVLREIPLLKICLPAHVEFSTVKQEVRPFQERVDIVADNFEQVDKLAVCVVESLYRAARLVE
jgi:hypothetical protein